MNIAMIHFRVGATDGVSLEMDKWKTVLEHMGHRVYYIAAESHGTDALIIPEISIKSIEHVKLFKNCYEELTDYSSEQALYDDILRNRDLIYQQLLSYINTYKIDLIIPNNVSSLGLHLPTGLAISKLISEQDIKVIYHHHDFYFERERYSHPTAAFINQLLKEHFPYHNSFCRHVVINRIAQKELKRQKGINAYVIPNVFDFLKPSWKESHKTLDLKEHLYIHDEDLVFLQATRIEDRKAIELALDVIHDFHNQKNDFVGRTLYNGKIFKHSSQIHFVIAGLNEMKIELYDKLYAKIQTMPFPVHIISDLIGSEHEKSDKPYSLWDTYPMADVITYPSILEGWGNQLLEGIFAKKPIIIYEYPVYISDLKPLGFNLLSLGSTHKKESSGLITIPMDRIKKVNEQLITILFSKEKYINITQYNFEIAKKHFSYQALEYHIKNITENI